MTARPAIALRPATPADLPGSAALYERARREIFAWEATAPCAPAEFARIFAGEEQTLAWAGTALVGLVSIYRAENFVHGLYVDPAWRGQGIGTLLLAAGLVDATGAARLKCNIGNPAARRFYERHGWREVARGGSRPEDWIFYMHDAPGRAGAAPTRSGASAHGP